MKTIPLTQGQYAVVDDEDYHRVTCGPKWRAQRVRNLFYAVRHVRIAGKRSREYLHRLVLRATNVERIDHRNGLGCDCQKTNLRIATNAENLRAFQTKQRGLTSKYRGVSWDKNKACWRGDVEKNNRHYFAGSFSSEEQAAHARDILATELFGSFAHLNFP